jgi:hypothetical protein
MMICYDSFVFEMRYFVLSVFFCRLFRWVYDILKSRAIHLGCRLERSLQALLYASSSLILQNFQVFLYSLTSLVFLDILFLNRYQSLIPMLLPQVVHFIFRKPGFSPRNFLVIIDSKMIVLKLIFERL